MIRRAIIIMSVLLAAATLVLGALSTSYPLVWREHAVAEDREPPLEIGVWDGMFYVARVYGFFSGPPARRATLLGVGFVTAYELDAPGSVVALIRRRFNIPLWLPIVLFATYPAIVFGFAVSHDARCLRLRSDARFVLFAVASHLIRKPLILIPLLAALATLALAAVSFETRPCWWRSIPDEHGVRFRVSRGIAEFVQWNAVDSALPQTATHIGTRNLRFRYTVDYDDRLTSFDWTDMLAASSLGTRELTIRISKLAFPLWAPFVLFSIYPAIALITFIRGPLRRYRRRRRGLCVRCGYDLTGNTTGICSECGEPT